jgi:uncharacterized membrane protein YhaH (DUF805 family)
MPIKQLLFSFEGRIPRSVFWMSLFVLGVVHLGVSAGLNALGENNSLPAFAVILVLIWFAFVFIAGLAIQVKRWHDRDKSGAWVLINLVPIIGGFWALIECGFLRGTEGPNDYGPDPLSPGAERDF